MKTSKQIGKESVNITVVLPVESYFRLKFEAEDAGYTTFSDFIRDRLIPRKDDDDVKEAQMRLDV